MYDLCCQSPSVASGGLVDTRERSYYFAPSLFFLRFHTTYRGSSPRVGCCRGGEECEVEEPSEIAVGRNELRLAVWAVAPVGPERITFEDGGAADTLHLFILQIASAVIHPERRER